MVDPQIQVLEERLAKLERKFEVQKTTQQLAHVSKIFPKSKTVVFVGKDYFGDNVKYAYLAFQEFARGKPYTCYFLTEDTKQKAWLEAANLPCLTSSHPDYIAILLSAKVAVLCDPLEPREGRDALVHSLLQGAKFIQLWHGIPLKEIGFKILAGANIMATCGPFDAFVATNASSRPDWEQRFSFHEFAPLGHPRNDVFLRDLTANDVVGVDRSALASIQRAHTDGKPVIFYAPTFRDHRGAAWFENASVAEYAKECDARGYALYINLHPIEHGAMPQLQQKYPHLRFLTPQTDAYPLVKYADMLITDYSSLAFDYLLLDRPILFYRPDHNEYITKARPLITGREHYSPGPVVSTVSDLLQVTEKTVSGLRTPSADPFMQARHALRAELFDYVDGGAGERVAQLIEKYLN